MDDVNAQAHEIATQLTAELVSTELDIVVAVKMELVINLGYDQGEQVNADRFLLGVKENLERLLSEIYAPDSITSVERLS